MSLTSDHKSPSRFPFDLVRPRLNEVEALIRDQVRAFDPGVEPYMATICDTSGKRIRPALAILCGGATGGVTDDHLQLGVILELIHMATLVHDDIIDGASTRRQLPTANSRWGSGMAVLLGDALFSHSLKLATDFDRLDLSRAISLASREVCEGEILQTQRRFDLTLSKAEYFRMIGMKTGALFAAASGLAALISGEDESVQKALYDYGMKLGTAYQIYDDCIDLIGDEEDSGKTLRTDLEKGKLTLPMLKLLEVANASQREKLSKRIIEQQPIDLPVLVGIAEYEGSVESAIETAVEEVAAARKCLKVLAPTEYRDALQDITVFVDQLLATCRR